VRFVNICEVLSTLFCVMTAVVAAVVISNYVILYSTKTVMVLLLQVNCTSSHYRDSHS